MKYESTIENRYNITLLGIIIVNALTDVMLDHIGSASDMEKNLSHELETLVDRCVHTNSA